MLLRLQPYNATIKYRPGKEMKLPDTLFMLPSIQHMSKIPLDVSMSHITFSYACLAQIYTDTNICHVLSTVFQLTTMDSLAHVDTFP